MNAFDKIQKVKESLSLYEKEKGNEFTYVLSDISLEKEGFNNTTEIISQIGVGRIVKYLEKKGYLEIIDESENSFKIKIRGNNKTIRAKTLELISKELKNYYSGTDIINILKDNDVSQSFIIYPETKWLMFYRVLNELSVSRTGSDQKKLSNIIGSSIHPLNLGGTSDVTKILLDKFNSWLKYDDYIIIEDSKHNYILLQNYPMEDMDDRIDEMIEDNERQQKEQTELEISFFQKTQNIESISVLHKSYKTLMDIIEVFCEDCGKPTIEMNDYYQKLKTIILDKINDLGLNNSQGYIEIYSLDQHISKDYYIPFANLFSAEKEFNERKLILNWNNIRPEMNMMFGLIDNLYQLVNASGVLSEPDAQKSLNDISLFLSKKKKEGLMNKNIKQNDSPIKIEIVKTPILKTQSVDENYIIKNNNKKVTLPKFSRTEWSKVSISFIDERNILLSDKRDRKPSSFEGLGCDDGRNGKPDENWLFLERLAKNGGQTFPNNGKDKEKQKKQKQKITDILRKIFQNDTDPFEIEKGGVYKAKFEIKYLNEAIEHKPKKIEYLDLEEEYSNMTELTQENIESEFS